jgi:putative acetyltransferase
VAEPTSSQLKTPPIRIIEVDPRGGDALALLHEAAGEARKLYPEHFAVDAPWPANPPTPERGVYLLGYQAGNPIACGALRPIDDDCVEIRRMFVTATARRRGLARVILRELEIRAAGFAYTIMRLETGNRQLSAMALYETLGFKRIAPFGAYVNDPLSICFEKTVQP